MNSIKIINSAKAFEIAGGNRELFCQMLELFIEIAPAQLERLNLAYYENELKELMASAHDIKSSASSFGGELLYNSALNLEQNVKNKLDLNSIVHMIKEVDNNIQITIQYYKSHKWEADFKEEL